MRSFSKRQVRNLLAIPEKGSIRPQIANFMIRDGYLFATDDYKAVGLWLEVDKNINTIVDYNDVVKWYKLASAKDKLTADDILAMKQLEHGTIDVLALKPEITQPISIIALNGRLLNDVQDALDVHAVELEFTTTRGQVKVTPVDGQDSRDFGIIMPVLSARARSGGNS